MTYDNFPLVLFFRLMMKGDALVERAIRMKVLPFSKVDWRKIKIQWDLKHEDEKGEAYLEAKKKVVTETIQYNKIVLLVQWLKKTKQDIRPMFEELRIPWSDDKAERTKSLNKLKNKAETRLNIYKAQLDKLTEQQKEEDQEDEFTMAKLHEAIASLELHGFDIPDYNTLTLAKYDAMTAVINNKIEKERLKELA